MPNAPPLINPDETRRLEDLARLLPLWPHQITDRSRSGREMLIATLERALRTERRRAHTAHWAYDLGRHAALVRILAAERLALKSIVATDRGPPKPVSRLLIAARAKSHLLGKL